MKHLNVVATIIVITLLFTGCAAPIRAEGNDTIAYGDEPASNSIVQAEAHDATDEPIASPSPSPQFLEELPYEDRLYLHDTDLVSTYNPYTELSFLAERSLSYDDLEVIAVKLEAANWLTFEDVLTEYDLYIDMTLLFSCVESNASLENYLKQCTLGTITSDYMVLKIEGGFGLESFDHFNIHLFFKKSNFLYILESALFGNGQTIREEFVTVGKNNFLVVCLQGDTGTEFGYTEEYWYNLTTKKLELTYTHDWFNGELILPYTKCYSSHNIEDYAISELSKGAFSIEMPISLVLSFLYFSNKETAEFLYGESRDSDKFEKLVSLTVYYDPNRNAFYIDKSDEPSFFIGQGFHPKHSQFFFNDEIIYLSNSDKEYHIELTDYLLD